MVKKDKRPEKINYAVYWRIISYIKKYMKIVFLSIGLSIIISFLHFGSLGMIKPICDLLFAPNGSESILKELQDFGTWGKSSAEWLQQNVFNDRYRALYIIMFSALVLVLIKNALRFFQEYLAGYITNLAILDISNELFHKVKQLPVSYFSNEGASQISSRFISDIPMMSKGLHAILGKAICEPLKALATIILAFIINWKLAAIICIIFPATGFFLKNLGKKIKRNAKKTLQKRSNMMGILNETFSGIRIVKAYLMEEKMQEKFAAENNKLFRYEMRVVAANAMTNPIMEVFIVLSGIGIMIFSAHQIYIGRMTIGDFGLFYGALAALFDPIRKLADLNNLIGTSVAGGERVFELMDTVPEIQDSPNATTLQTIENSITFQNVWFAYKPEQFVLKDISFSVRAGEKIALVGCSGAGKSTIVSLLMRFYDIQKGSISFDGVDVRNIKLRSLREHIGIVTQEAYLFNETIANNISCCQNPKKSQAIIQASQDAYADIFIQRLSQSYDTIYGPNGIDLSGGQKHRIALARAMYKDPKILILDEAMANLDAESESYILKALEAFTANRTVFIIAHRFSTIQKVDRILVLEDNGTLAGFGTHAELIQTCGVYQKLYQKQILANLPTQ